MREAMSERCYLMCLKMEEEGCKPRNGVGLQELGKTGVSGKECQ